MPFATPRRRSVLFAAGLGTALAAGLAVQPVQAAGVAPAAGRAAAAPLAAQAVPGRYTLAASALYLGPAVKTATNTVTFTGVPSTVSALKIAWGDYSEPSVVRRASSGRLAHRYEYSGVFRVTVTAVDEAGESAPRSIGVVSVKLDYTNPTAKLTKPSKKKRAKVAAWRTLKGKASDRGAGVLYTVAAVFQQRGSTWYYYKGGKWKKGSPYKQATVNKAYRYVKPVRTGAWSLKLKGLKKGKLVVLYYALDKVGNHPLYATVVKANLTR